VRFYDAGLGVTDNRRESELQEPKYMDPALSIIKLYYGTSCDHATWGHASRDDYLY